MQPIRHLETWLFQRATAARFLFSTTDLRGLFPDLSDGAFKTLLSRGVSSGMLTRVCRGIYLFPKARPTGGELLFHVAALLRPNGLNYLSLETVLSDSGVISQMPMNWITCMSSGRSNRISCGDFGTLEFVHTNRTPDEVAPYLTYDPRCGLWRASVGLALQDMKRTRRSMDLINWEVLNDLI